MAEHGKTETDGSGAGSGLYDVVSDDQQCRYSTSDDVMQSQLTLFITANKPTSAGGGSSTAATAAGNPIDKLYSMQTSYFTAN